MHGRTGGLRSWAIVVVALVASLALAACGGSSHHSDSSARTTDAASKPAKPPPPPPPPQLPRGGRRIFPGHRVVAYYGIIGTTNILGRTEDPDADAAGVEQQAAAYAPYGLPVLPAFEMVTTVASPDPGPDGTYSAAEEPAVVARYVAAAKAHKLLLIMDFQPGRGEFLPEVERYARYLLDPGVGVGLDPEWKLTADEFPDEVIGHSSAASVNAVSAWLSKFVAEHRLPQKLFIVHEFHLDELPDRQNIVFHSNLATVLQMDGLGAYQTKLQSYRDVMRGGERFNPGFKVFTNPSDDPTLFTPPMVMGLHPRPVFISYQ